MTVTKLSAAESLEASGPATTPSPATKPQPPAPADVPRAAIVTLALLAVLFAMRLAKDFCIAVVIGLMISYALEPLVGWMARHRVPRSLAAALVLLTLVGGLGSAVYVIEDDAAAFLDTVPLTADKLREVITAARPAAANAVGKMEKLADAIEKSASEAAAPAPPPHGVTPVQIQTKPIDVRGYLWSGSLGLVALAAETALLLFLTYFLLASGDLFKRKLVQLIGSSLARKRVTLQVLEDIDRQIQRFLVVRLLASLAIGTGSALAFHALGLDHAILWGIAAGLLNSIPYFGPGIVTVGVTLATLVQHGTISMALLVGGASLVLASLDGFVLVPLLIRRTARMNEVATFAGLLFWGWMWGSAGLLLAVPIMMIIKAICDRVDDLKPVGELLGE